MKDNRSGRWGPVSGEGVGWRETTRPSGDSEGEGDTEKDFQMYSLSWGEAFCLLEIEGMGGGNGFGRKIMSSVWIACGKGRGSVVGHQRLGLRRWELEVADVADVSPRVVAEALAVVRINRGDLRELRSQESWGLNPGEPPDPPKGGWTNSWDTREDPEKAFGELGGEPVNCQALFGASH